MWDYRLIKAHYLLEDWYRDGIPIWWDESDRVTFDAKARFSKSRAATERAQEADGKKKSKVYGKYYTAEPRVMDGGEFPTRDEWLEEQETKRGSTVDRRKGGPQILQGKK
tara:strand:- start:143 stop:472 length:330 start_codon:yes stop_codon:yes gene_type:complete